jgi:hypothetical protein
MRQLLVVAERFEMLAGLEKIFVYSSARGSATRLRRYNYPQASCQTSCKSGISAQIAQEVEPESIGAGQRTIGAIPNQRRPKFPGWIG